MEDRVKIEDHNKKTISAYFNAVDDRDLERARELLADDFKLHAPGLPEPVGNEILFQAIQTFHTAFPDHTHTIEAMVAEGDHVAVRLNRQATHEGEFQGIPATGKKVSLPAMIMATIVDGRIKEIWAVEDNLWLRQQLGDA